MMDTLTLKLDSPLTEEQINLITDAEFEHTDKIWFTTPKGKVVEFVKAQQWIPCSERLPEDEEFYLVTVNNGEFYVDFSFWEGKEFIEHDGEVIAWMPLPEPWKGDKE